MSVSPIEYTGYRDRLTSLLERSEGLPGLLPKSAKEISHSRRKLKENQFEIVLVGEFQGGKSTTFNCFCDGREISPRGKGGGGLKTSGCIVRAQNLSDKGEQEHAIVRWRTPEELLMGFDEMLRRHLASTGKSSDGGDNDPVNLMDVFNPETEDGRNAIKEAAGNEIQQWENAPAIFDLDDIGLIDLVRFSLIVAEFYADESIAKLREQTRFSIEEVRRFVTFPEDWQTRWKDWDVKTFSPEEIIFAFVGQVDCHLHSPNLGRLGCAITDCPGLFASSWDTKVAQDALLRADAVLYLISGDKQLSLSDLKSVRSLRIGQGMIFVGVNCRTQTWEMAEKIRLANHATLQQQGLEIPEENVHLYHAGLALFSKHLEKGITNLDRRTIDVLKSDLSAGSDQDVEKRVVKKISQFRENLDPHDDDFLFAWREDHSSHAKSRLPGLLDAVENFVISRKAESVLCGNAERVRNALKETEASLQYAEDNARKRLEEREREFAQAEKILDGFETSINPMLENLGESAPELLAESFWNKLNDNKDKYINESSARLSKEIRKTFFKFIRNRKEVVRKIEGIARKEFDKWLKEQADSWIQEIRNGKNHSYHVAIVKPLLDFKSSLDRYWHDAQEREMPELEGIVLPTISNLQPNTGIELSKQFIDAVTNILQGQEFFVKTIAAIVGTIVITMLILILSPILAMPAAAWLIPLLILAFPEFREWITPQGLGAPALKRKIADAIGELKEPLKDKIRNETQQLLKDLRKYLRDEVVLHPRQVYENRKQDALDAFQLAEADRIRKAEEAKKVRETHVAPLRGECDSFLEEVKPLFS